MSEKTIPAIEALEDENYFGEEISEIAEGANPGGAEPSGEEISGSQDIPEPATEEKYKVKYNGREFELSLDELITHAQKGMNYDHVLAERDAYKNAPELALLEKLAKAQGLKRQDYLVRLEEEHRERAVNELVRQGVPGETARELYELRQKAEMPGKEKISDKEEKAPADRRLEELFEFHAAYPEVQTLPSQVLADIARGKTPLAAYQAYEIARLSSELATERKNAGNKRAAIGSVQDRAAVPPGDDFLTGWNNA